MDLPQVAFLKHQKVTPAAIDQKSGLYSGISVVHRGVVPGNRR
jgi:hypothetical protein